MKLLPCLSLFILLGCNTPPPAKPDVSAPVPTSSLQSVQVVTQGGQMGYYARCTITVDSVMHQSGTTMDSTQNTSGARKTSAAEWQLLVQSINTEEFKAAQNGESQMPFDGTDTEITLTTNSERLSKTNAAGSPTWTGIEQWAEKNCR